MNRMISFGYGFVDGKLSVIAEEAEIVKGIFSDYTNGKILKEIADDLTTRKVDFFNVSVSSDNSILTLLFCFFIKFALSNKAIGRIAG